MSDQYTPELGEVPSRVPLSAVLWKEVMFLDNFTCIYCGARSADITVDHFIPVSLGGPEVIQNLVACCLSCNTKKSARAPYECRMAPRFGRYAYVTQSFTPKPATPPGDYETIIVGGHPIRIDRLAGIVRKSVDELRQLLANNPPEGE